MAARLRQTLNRLGLLASGAAAVPLSSALAAAEAGPTAPSTGPYVLSTTSYPANDPIEDRFDYRVKDGKLFSAVIDGHGGWQAAEYARIHLIDMVQAELAHIPDANEPAQIAGALSRAFNRLDRAFVSSIKPAFELGFGDVAHVGCCALASVTTRSHIVVANAGDCRAIVGRVITQQPAKVEGESEGSRLVEKDESNTASTASSSSLASTSSSPDGSQPPQWLTMNVSSRPVWYQAVPLSFDNNAREPRERKRLEAEHPGEPDIVVCRPDNPTACYVKGRLQPTRAIGDAYLKHSEFNAPPGLGRQYGRHIRPPYTPPYITAQPEIRVHRVDPVLDARSFLILACDGVWDVLSNEEAVAFVAADTGDKATVSDRLRDHVLTRAADDEGMDIAWIRGLKKGSGGRRSVHDDITVIVSYIGKAHMSSREGALGSDSLEGGAARKGWW